LILYLDTSAIVKRYVIETSSKEVIALIEEADAVGSVVLTRVEMAATLAKAVRQNWLERNDAESAWQDFLEHWFSFTRLNVTPVILERASRLAWEHGLRGYDAMHFAAALIWQETLENPITLATFDRELWLAAQKTGLAVWPEGLYF
jgi:predicted nucleic acid-binding protein